MFLPRVIKLGRTVTTLLAGCAVLAACSSGGGSPDRPSASTKAPTSKPSRFTPPKHGDISLGDLNTKSFSYSGGCGFEIPAPTIKLTDGKQTEKTQEFDGRSSTAEWTGSKEITLGDQQYLLVYLTCTVGDEKLISAHLIGRAGQRPTDLGIIGTGSKITVNVDHDQLAVDLEYQTLKDKDGKASGSTSYKITMAGVTPVRLFTGEQPDAIDPAIAKLPAHGYDAGLVGISGYVDDKSETSWVVGLLDKPNRVLTADSLGGGYDSGICWKPTIYTQAAESIGHRHLAFNGEDNQTGTGIDLAESSRAAVGSLGKINFPVTADTKGLLIPANGVVPALATATTKKAANGQGDAIVTTKAPADASIDIDHFGAAGGSEYPLPIGAFATGDGKIAMTGAWYNEPVDMNTTASGMRPVVDPARLGEKTCG